MDQTPFFLYLNPNHIQFDPVTDDSQSKGVFYDEGNQQMFIVTRRHDSTSNTMDVNVKGPDPQSDVSFNLDDTDTDSEIHSIKFNPSCSVLVVQRTNNMVSFVNFSNGQPTAQYSFSSKTRNTQLLGFCWTNIHDIVFITTASLEFCQVTPDKRQVKILRCYSMSISWFLFHPKTSFLVVAMGSASNIMQTLQFVSGTMYKIAKFEVDVGAKTKSRKLAERDVSLVTLYGQLFLLVLKHNVDESGMQTGSQVLLYSFQKDAIPKVSHVLDLELTGRFAFSVVDNLILVHHQTSQTSLVFDIRTKESRAEGDNLPHFKTIIPPLTIEPFYLSNGTPSEMYSRTWALFQPNIIIDHTVGCLWKIDIRLEAICQLLSSNPSSLVDFLILRRNSKHHLLRITREAIEGKVWTKSGHLLGTLSLLFNKFNQAWKQAQEAKVDKSPGDLAFTTIDQSDMYSNVFCLLDTSIPEDFGAAVLFEYVHSLTLNEVPIQYMTYQKLINHLIRCRMFYQLQQFLQYHVFQDSKPLACLLLSLQDIYPHATQLSLDMFKRLSIAHEDMIDVYISVTSNVSVLRALRFVLSSQDCLDSVSARKFLEVARNALDDRTFFTVYKLFELRNLRTRGSPSFVEGEQCDSFVREFMQRFSVSSSLSLPTTDRSQSSPPVVSSSSTLSTSSSSSSQGRRNES